MRNWLLLLLHCPDYTRHFNRISRQLTRMNKEIKDMAINFERLTAAVDRISQEVTEVVEIIKNPAVDNNDQMVIDDIAGRLEGAADALDAVAEETNAEEVPTEPEGTPTENPAPAEGEDATFINGSSGEGTPSE
jgi:uncharacterized membrane protein